MPGWVMLILQILNVVISGLTVGVGTYFASGHEMNGIMQHSPDAAITAGLAAVVQQLRSNPFAPEKLLSSERQLALKVKAGI